MAVDAVILLGGNLGDVRGSFSLSCELLESMVGQIKQLSSQVETLAWGFAAKERFLNQCVVVTTELSPQALLRATQAIELEVGRNREQERSEKMASGERYASRVIDVDIITYGEQVVSVEGLDIPHKRMHEREFVLAPMAEVAPHWRHPILNMSVVEMIASLNNRSGE